MKTIEKNAETRQSSGGNAPKLTTKVGMESGAGEADRRPKAA